MRSRTRPSFLTYLAALAAPVLFAACGGNVVVTGGGEGASGGSGGDGGAGGTPTTVTENCAPGLTECGDLCVNVATDAENCGKCFNSCQGGACQGGQCVIGPGCPPNLTECNGTCVNIATDPAHCGMCNSPCPPGTACIGGSCEDSCICGAICKYTDLGSGVPQSATVSVSSLGDTYNSDCGPVGNWPDVSFLFTAPFKGVFTFDTFGSVDTAIQVMSLGCALYSCNDDASPDGTSLVSLELGGGQQVLVFVDAIAASGSVTLHVSEGKECASCADYITGENIDLPLCDFSQVLYDDLVNCICLETCAMACGETCNGGDFTPECEQCISDTVNGCGNSLNDCFNDI